MGNRTKLLLILIMLFVLNSNSIAIAENTLIEYNLTDVGITMSIPDTFIVLKKNTTVDSNMLNILGMTQEEVEDYLRDNNFSLYGYSAELDLLITVTMGEGMTSSLKKYDDEELEKYRDFILPLIENGSDCQVIGKAIYHHEDVPFFFYWIEGKEIPYSGIDCFTNFDMKYIQIILMSQNRTLDFDDTLLAHQIIDSIVFPHNASLKDIDPNISQYYDEECNVSFDIPQGWVQTPFNEEREYLEAKFSLAEDDGTTSLIMYQSEDLWSSLETEEKNDMLLQGKTRKNIDETYLSIDDIIQETGIENVKQIMYGKYPFFILEMQATSSKLGVTFTLYCRRAICIHNGYVLNFLYSSIDKDYSNYNDLEEMLKSVSFIE